MKHQLVVFGLVFYSQVLFIRCDLGDSPQPDPQFVKIQFQYSFSDMIDTFNGTLTKDLILDGSVTIPFWLTTSEQESLLEELDRADFFNLPDTLLSIPGVALEPNPSPDFLRVVANGKNKVVIWSYPIDLATANGQSVMRLSTAIRNIVESKPEYKQLPPARGGYN
ncbi:MAG TPA: hypothetical protein VGB89_14555 [Bacteroidota bacterium]